MPDPANSIRRPTPVRNAYQAALQRWALLEAAGETEPESTADRFFVEDSPRRTVGSRAKHAPKKKQNLESI